MFDRTINNSTTDLAFYSTSLDSLPSNRSEGWKFGIHKIFHLLLVVSSFCRGITISQSFCFLGLYRTLVGSILGLYACILSKNMLQCWLCVGDEMRCLFFSFVFLVMTGSGLNSTNERPVHLCIFRCTNAHQIGGRSGFFIELYI